MCGENMNTLKLSSSLHHSMYGIDKTRSSYHNKRIHYNNRSKSGFVETTDKISYNARRAADRIDDFADFIDELCNPSTITLEICYDLSNLSRGISDCDSIINGLLKISDASRRLRNKLEDKLEPFSNVLDSAIDLLGAASNALAIFHECFEPSPNSLLGRIFGFADCILGALYVVTDLSSDVLNTVYGLIANLDGLVQDAIFGLLNDINDGLNLVNSTLGLLCIETLMSPLNILSPLNLAESYRQNFKSAISF
jgi:hypothetical protein